MLENRAWRGRTAVIFLSVFALGLYTVGELLGLFWMVMFKVPISLMSIVSLFNILIGMVPYLLLVIFGCRKYRGEKEKILLGLILLSFAVKMVMSIVTSVLFYGIYGGDMSLVASALFYGIYGGVIWIRFRTVMALLFTLAAVGVWAGFSKKALPMVASIGGMVMYAYFMIRFFLHDLPHILMVSSENFILLESLTYYLSIALFCTAVMVFVVKNYSSAHQMQAPASQPPSYAAPQPQYAAPQPTYAAPPQQPTVQVSPEQALWELTERYKRGMVPPAEYQAQRAALLNLLK